MADTETKMDIIITFMAVLEMMKHGSIVVRQDHAFDDIEIESKMTEEDGEADTEENSTEDIDENPSLEEKPEEEKEPFTEDEKMENVTEKAEEDGRE